MARIRADYVFGTTDTALADVDTTLSSPALARLPVVTAPDVAAVTMHDSAAGTFEIVYVTAHAAAATTATIARAAEGTTAQAWPSGTTWLHGATAADLDGYVEAQGVPRLSSGTAEPTDPVDGQMWYDDDAVFGYAVAAADVSADDTAFTNIVGSDVQAALDSIDGQLGAAGPATVTASAVRATMGATQALTSGSFVIVTWGAESFDTAGYHSTASNTSRLTIPTGLSGVFEAVATVYFSYTSGGTGGERIVQVRKNSVAGNAGVVARSEAPTSTGSHAQQVCTGPLQLAAGDYLEVEAYHDSGGSWYVDTAVSFFSLNRIGD